MSTYRYLISACLCGQACRYDGQARPATALARLVEQGLALSICPEVDGGLPIPRTPCERQAGRVIDQNGQDRTQAYQAGAEHALALAQKYHITTAILKERSPSCGSGRIYDGTFTRNLIPGDGVAAARLREEGLTVYGESSIGQLLKDLERQV